MIEYVSSQKSHASARQREHKDRLTGVRCAAVEDAGDCAASPIVLLAKAIRNLTVLMANKASMGRVQASPVRHGLRKNLAL